MRNRLFIIVMLFAVILLCTACGSDNGTGQNNNTQQSQNTATGLPDTEVTTQQEGGAAKNYPIDFHTETFTLKNSDGYEFEISLKYTPWILQSNTDLVKSAWQQLGQTSEIPTIDKGWNTKKYVGDYYSLGNLFNEKMNDMYYILGTFSVKNITEGWSFSSDKPGNISFGMAFPYKPAGYTTERHICLLYKVYYSEPVIKGVYQAFFSSYMKSNTWGPAAFIIGAPEYFSPNKPEGTAIEYIEDVKMQIATSFLTAYSFEIGIQK